MSRRSLWLPVLFSLSLLVGASMLSGDGGRAIGQLVRGAWASAGFVRGSGSWGVPSIPVSAPNWWAIGAAAVAALGAILALSLLSWRNRGAGEVGAQVRRVAGYARKGLALGAIARRTGMSQDSVRLLLVPAQQASAGRNFRNPASPAPAPATARRAPSR